MRYKNLLSSAWIASDFPPDLSLYLQLFIIKNNFKKPYELIKEEQKTIVKIH